MIIQTLIVWLQILHQRVQDFTVWLCSKFRDIWLWPVIENIGYAADMIGPVSLPPDGMAVPNVQIIENFPPNDWDIDCKHRNPISFFLSAEILFILQDFKICLLSGQVLHINIDNTEYSLSKHSTVMRPELPTRPRFADS